MRTELPRIGPYELRRRLSSEATSEVWQAYDNRERLPVIFKVYRIEAADNAQAVTDFLARARRVADLHHPNIVPVHDIQVLSSPDIEKNRPLVGLAIQYVEGETLADYSRTWSAAGKMPPASDLVSLCTSLALALENARQHGIVHGNLKPTNIFLVLDKNAPGKIGTPQLTDFSQARFEPKGIAGASMPFYLAPEQVRGEPATERSDVYALGVILYELCTGTLPFRGNRPVAIMMQHVNAQPTAPDLVNPGLSAALTQVILHCLEKDPQKRFPNASALAIALANALHVALPEHFRHSPALAGGSANAFSPAPPRQRSHEPEPATPVQTQTAAPVQSPGPRPRRRNGRVALTVAALLLLGASLGAWLTFIQLRLAPTPVEEGQAFFLNSGQLNATTTQGLNDELQITLSNVTAPASGQSYYAWLLGDIAQTETSPLLLGRLTVTNGTIHFLYISSQHTNLLGEASRFLINEDSTTSPSSDPLLNQNTWRYYAALPQTPDTADQLHFSMLDHLRHLLVESPDLAFLGLHGGLAFWFARETAEVSDLASNLASSWQQKDTTAIMEQDISILDYLDGIAFSKTDLPARTPFLIDQQSGQVPLLGPAPQTVDPPGYVYQDEPPAGYVYLLQSHLNGAVLSPQATSVQHQLAQQISNGIDADRRLLMQVYQDARQLLGMSSSQLQTQAALTIINTMVTQAQDAYTGQANPATGTSQSGSLWIYNNIQRLAAFNVTPYTVPGRQATKSA